jgi:hypothetical protein
VNAKKRTVPLVLRWRKAVEICPALDLVAVAVAHTIGNYMNADGACWPSQVTVAAGAKVCKKSVRNAVVTLQAAGLLEVRRGFGRSSSRYQAVLPETDVEVPVCYVDREGNVIPLRGESVSRRVEPGSRRGECGSPELGVKQLVADGAVAADAAPPSADFLRGLGE